MKKGFYFLIFTAFFATQIIAMQEIQELELRANQGDSNAQNELAIILWQGNPKFRDRARARALLELAVSQGDNYARCNLAKILQEGQSRPQDRARARALLELAASQGEYYAQIQLSHMLRKQGGQENLERAVLLLEQVMKEDHGAINDDHLDEIFADAFMYFRDMVERKNGIPENPWQARLFYERNRDWHTAGNLELASMLYHGKGGPKDLQDARQLYENYLAIEEEEEGEINPESDNHRLALIKLAHMLYLGEGGPQDLPKARNLYEKVVEKEVTARVPLAHMLHLGEGGNSMPERAYDLFEKAAHDGDKEAEMNLILMRALGPRDDVKLRAFYEQLANRGINNFRYLFANALHHGIGGDPDLPKALTLYQQAANEGHMGARTALENLLRAEQSKSQDINEENNEPPVKRQRLD